ncbi:MAG: heme ABC exporter ATP-binding protein CcmA [Wenzhouxiangella sp.]|nr:MAG: heme ABC exporter ATP-binding protein CcmA [Wenzhouxiangella sp.]
MSALLLAEAVGFSRSGDLVFDPVDVCLASGKALVIAGPNGSGKTTLLRLLAGILTPACGQVQQRGSLAFLGHLAAVKGDLTVGENLQFTKRFCAGPGLPVNQALGRVGLAGLSLRPARALSAGQKRRVGLACLLVARRDTWLLDEPYASLDDIGGELVDSLLEQHLAEGGAVALSTHQRQPRLQTEPDRLMVRPARQGGG